MSLRVEVKSGKDVVFTKEFKENNAKLEETIGHAVAFYIELRRDRPLGPNCENNFHFDVRIAHEFAGPLTRKQGEKVK